MKKLSLLFFTLLCVSVMYGQKGKVSAAVNYEATNDLDAAKEAIDVAMGNEKSNTWPKTFIVAAKVYASLDRAGKLDNGYEKAVEFYKKAIELDEIGDDKGKGKNKFSKEIKLALTMFTGDLTNAAIDNFNKENFEGALFNFESILWANRFGNSNYEEASDSVFIWNAALGAYNAKNWPKSELYLNKSIDLKYPGPDAVLLLNNVYTETKENDKLVANLKKGLSFYPENQTILTTLIQHYITEQQNDAALEYLNSAIEKDANNPSFYYARGVLYESTDKNKSIENYEKSLSIDPQFFNSLYNIGVIYYNFGVEASNKANDLTDYKEFEKAKNAADEIFKKSLPYMERAAEIQPNEPAVLESLKSLYYRFEMMEKYNAIKTKLENM
ncbi:MAG: tetratricopeptide repeat protein [Breznakibacter sp.]